MSKTGSQIATDLLKKQLKKKVAVAGVGAIGTSVLGVLGALLLIIILAGGIAGAISSIVPDWFNKGIEAPGLSEIGAGEIPAQYIPIYQRASEAYPKVPWTLLAAVHRVETTFSTDLNVSSAGAIGHMQFMPRTWIGWSYPGTRLGDADISESILTDPVQIAKYGGYGMDANGDGKADPYDIEDAVFTAAKYLSANGGDPFDPQKALHAYNQSHAYYLEVMGYAEEYTDGGFTAVIGGGTGATTGPLPYQAISMEWMDSIAWTIDGSQKIGLNAELKNQLLGRGIGIPHSMIYVLVMTKDKRNDEKSAKAFAAVLAPRDLKVVKVQKTITTKTKKGAETTTNTRMEDMLFVTSVRTYKGVYTYKIGYQTDEQSSTSDDVTTTVITKTPVLASTDLKEDDQIIDEALKAAHLRGRQAKKDFYILVKLVDPTFSDSNLPFDNQEIIIGESGGSYGIGQLQWVVPGFFTLSSPFGTRTDPVTGEVEVSHKGMDIPAPVGTPTVAANDGVVEVAQKNNAKAGNFVVIDHGNGMKTRYLHMNKLYVHVGQIVKRGQVIGQVGDTGKSTGPHMHTEVIINGTAVDPLPYYRSQKGNPSDGN